MGSVAILNFVGALCGKAVSHSPTKSSICFWFIRLVCVCGAATRAA